MKWPFRKSPVKTQLTLTSRYRFIRNLKEIIRRILLHPEKCDYYIIRTVNHVEINDVITDYFGAKYRVIAVDTTYVAGQFFNYEAKMLEVGVSNE
jgi:hypothetical protein